MNVTFIGAHPDDEMSCLGTLLLYRRRGDQLSFICATNGDKGMSDNPGFPHTECARIRSEEMDAVSRALDAEYVGLGEPDEALYDTWDNRVKMIEAIRHLKPDVIFTHYAQDYNLDHTATSALVFQAALLSQIASVQTNSPPLARVPPIFHVDPGPGFGFEATHFVEIDEATTTEALRIMGCHKSQMNVSRRLLGKDYRDSIAERWKAAGERVGARFAEAFRPCLASRRTPLARVLP